MSDLLPPPSLPAPTHAAPSPPLAPPPSAQPTIDGADTSAMTFEPVGGPRRNGRMWFLVAAVVAVLACGVGALLVLGGGDDGGTDAAAYSLAAAAEGATTTETVAFEIVVEAGAVGEVRMSGAVDSEAQLMTMSVDLASVLGVGDGESSVEAILDVANGVMYLNAEALGEMLPLPVTWVSMDLAAVAEMSGQSLDDLRDQFAVDPTSSADLLIGEDAVEVGLEDIDGEQLMHYQVDVDLADALAANPQAQQQLDESGLDLGASLPDTITYDVWVSEANQLRRMSFELPLAGDVLRTQIDMHSYDEPLEVEIPSGDDVFDITELAGL